MSLVDRIKNICLTPKTEWDVIAPEQTETAKLFINYVAPLVAIGVVANFVSSSLIGKSSFFGATVRIPMMWGVGWALVGFVLTLIGVFIAALIVNALAPTFGAEKNPAQALKVAVYSFTPAWIAGILFLIPYGAFLILLAACYCLYVLYTGLPKLMKCPEDKAVGYTAVVAICSFVVMFIFGALTTCIGGAGMLATGAMTGQLGERASKRAEVTFDKDSAIGKLEALGKKMEESGKKMEAAQKSGDQGAQVAAAMEALGTLTGGGKRVEPMGIDQLKPFVPETLGGLAKKSSKTEKTGIAGLMISKAEARYGDDGGKSLELDISDTGGASGFMALASWVNVQGEKEDEYGTEKTQKIDGRMVHEKVSKKGGTHEYSVLIGERFMVTVRGTGVSFEEVKSAAKSIDMAKLESMKAVGVAK
jgi:Yip1 domain